MGPGNPQEVRVWIRKIVLFGSRPIQKPDPEILGWPNPYLYPLIHRFCGVWVDSSVPVSSSPFRVSLFMVAVRYVTVMCKILTLVQHSLYCFHWQPVYSKQGDMLPATSWSWVWSIVHLASFVRFEVQNSHIDCYGSHSAGMWSVWTFDCADNIWRADGNTW